MSVIPIVGIGASAGGLEALKIMIGNTSPQTGAAFVIVQHLSPDQKSILHELLQGQTDMPVSQIEDGEAIQANHFYVVPPGTVASIKDNHLYLVERDSEDALHRPIDAFFKSLAAARGRNAYCVVLSGTGNDGSAGLKEVKGSGGFALVQESKGARFPGMPDSAVATGLVDFILPVEKISARLDEIIQHHLRLSRSDNQESLKEEIEAALPRFSERLQAVVGNDFSDYKPGTLVRRIERRMAVLRILDVERFIKTLEDSNEARLLAQEFLIGVTQFFRNPEAFEVLKDKVVDPILSNSESTIRIWVPGCSTGEEAYSLAMLFIEEMEARGDRRVLQVFGTDIDTPSLVSARYGLYSADTVEKLSPERRERFFHIENGEYRADPKLREVCVFAPHNLLQDPPFSRLDLISCRNLLIYLSANLQKKVIPRFHFSLRGEGHLFLGPSEGLAGDDNLFDVVDKTHRIFRRNAKATTSFSTLLQKPGRPKALPVEIKQPAPEPNMALDLSRETAVEQEFLRNHAAPFALLSSRGEVLYLSRKMTELVRPTQGAPSTLVDAYLANELRLPVRTALSEAIKTGEPMRIENIVVVQGDTRRLFDVEVSPSGSNFILVLTEVRALDVDDIGEAVGERETADRDILETENVKLRKQLTATMQEYESSGQELKSSNEELMSMNEELQSSNEELETSREELQSINEELETVNAELQENNRLLIRANSDLKNLFEATDLAVLFLDREFCVRNFTPSTVALFGIRQRDIGRPISDLSSRIDYPDLEADAHKVDETLQSFEREVTIPASGQVFLLRIKPYRTTDNRLDGYVLSFIDITDRKSYEETLKRNERAMARQYAELENLYDTTPVGLALIDTDYKWVRVNECLAEINGFSVADHIGKSFKDLLPALADTLENVCHHVIQSGQPLLEIEIEGETVAAPGAKRNWIGDYYPVWQDGKVFAVGICVREVTDQARMMQRIQKQNDHLNLLLGELQHRVKNTLATISSISKLLLKGVAGAVEYQARLEDRLGSISRTHDLLTDADWSTAKLSEIIRNEAAPYEQRNFERIRITGPDLRLSSKEALALGMALHELTTNAAKYGALSVEGGHIVIGTQCDTREVGTKARIVWKEFNGPLIASPPDKKGFGTLVLERVLGSDLSGEVKIEFNEEGLCFQIDFELEGTNE
ncbi:two-component system CheB/CheR fusion protein [Sagittula marina]|uniref:histidine kinase n=1 Tax=Sagittula marina TaxID=943940 RepID=A0A7W6DLA9_9RHOB|nr:chemotaxis protein CheB [Sagittula marina]MBB3985073.1 two-component system CheB/CheR fusion protein [Sagittula marina]